MSTLTLYKGLVIITEAETAAIMPPATPSAKPLWLGFDFLN